MLFWKGFGSDLCSPIALCLLSLVGLSNWIGFALLASVGVVLRSCNSAIAFLAMSYGE